MFLHSLEIKNYRSLENVKLEGLERFNVLIGRNNSGKSSIFGTLTLLNNTIRGSPVDWETVPTAKDKTRSLEIRLLFHSRESNREDFLALLCAAGQVEGRREAMRESSLLRQIEFSFKSPPGRPDLLHLRTTRVLAEDNRWADVQKMVGNEHENNPTSRVVNIGTVASRVRSERLQAKLLNVEGSPSVSEIRLPPNYVAQGEFLPDQATRWPLARLEAYLRKAFFFNPFRHSTARLQVQQTDQLSQDGSNLAQVLHTINSNDRLTFLKIEEFVQAALPDVGILQPPLVGNMTEVGFRSPDGGYLIRLHDMGGGIEQLLMVATVLFTTNDESTLFIEEPESHLHPGAQRFLVEKLYHGNRQLFLTTHSPTFVNLSRPRRFYQVKYAGNRTTVNPLDNADSLGAMLADIGSRNSDILLSDAVLFVEGPGDREALLAWSETLGSSLEERNVTVLAMGGGETADRSTRVRSEVLTGISQQAPVPHLFVLDRDERSQSEIVKMRDRLGDRIHFLHGRELENYLLVPRALLAAIRSKCHDEASVLEKINAVSLEEVNKLIRTTAESLYGLVLLKRIRSELGGLLGGLLPRDTATSLASGAQKENLAHILREEIELRLKNHLTNLDIDRLVSAQREALDKEWSDVGQRLMIAPGEEIVAAVFNHFGSQYKKPDDTVRIAREMRADEIPEEIKELMKKVIALTELT